MDSIDIDHEQHDGAAPAEERSLEAIECIDIGEEQGGDAAASTGELLPQSNNELETIDITWCGVLVMPLASFGLYVADVFTDIFLAYTYYAQYDSLRCANYTHDETRNHTSLLNDTVEDVFSSAPSPLMYFWLTLAFVIVPAVSMSLVNVNAYFLMDDYPSIPILQKWFRILCLVCCISPVACLMENIYFGLKYKQAKKFYGKMARLCAEHKGKWRERKKSFAMLLVGNKRTAAKVRLVEGFMENAPQLILQLYIMANEGITSFHDALTGKFVFRYISMFLSLSSLAWAVTSSRPLTIRLNRGSAPNANEEEPTRLHTLIMFMGQFLSIFARVFAIGWFATFIPWLLCPLIILHFLGMFVWLSLATPDCRYPLLYAAVSVFTYLPKTDWISFRSYYLICGVENAIMILAWLARHGYSGLHYPFLMHYITFFVGICVWLTCGKCAQTKKGVGNRIPTALMQEGECEALNEVNTDRCLECVEIKTKEQSSQVNKTTAANQFAQSILYCFSYLVNFLLTVSILFHTDWCSRRFVEVVIIRLAIGAAWSVNSAKKYVQYRDFLLERRLAPTSKLWWAFRIFCLISCNSPFAWYVEVVWNSYKYLKNPRRIVTPRNHEERRPSSNTHESHEPDAREALLTVCNCECAWFRIPFFLDCGLLFLLACSVVTIEFDESKKIIEYSSFEMLIVVIVYIIILVPLRAVIERCVKSHYLPTEHVDRLSESIPSNGKCCRFAATAFGSLSIGAQVASIGLFAQACPIWLVLLWLVFHFVGIWIWLFYATPPFQRQSYTNLIYVYFYKPSKKVYFSALYHFLWLLGIMVMPFCGVLAALATGQKLKLYGVIGETFFAFALVQLLSSIWAIAVICKRTCKRKKHRRQRNTASKAPAMGSSPENRVPLPSSTAATD